MNQRVPFAAMVHFGEGCWEWIGARCRKGYGSFRHPETNSFIGAHRYAYEMAHGTIPPGLVICHSCDNPRCVRRDHLFAGSPSVNQKDSVAKRRHVNSKKTHCPAGHEFTEENMYIYGNSRKCKTCVNMRATARQSGIREARRYER